MPTITLRPTAIIGRRCQVVWRNADGSFLRADLDPKDYDALAKPNAGPVPPPAFAPDAIFVGATEHPLFDTPSGRLEAGCLVEKSDGWMVVKTGRGSPKADRFLIDRTKHNPRGTGDTFAADVPGVTILDGKLTY